MKNLFMYFIIIILLALYSSCGSFDKGASLSENSIENYIKVYKQLREQAPDLLESINQNPENNIAGNKAYEKIVKIMNEGGFNGYKDFVLTNAKIGAIFSIMQANKGMENFENLNDNSVKMLDQGIAEYEKLISDPDIPESNKEEYRKAIEELEKNKKELSDKWDKNSKIAEFVIEKTNKISGLIVNEADIKLVKKYESQIMEAYTGFQMPELPNGKFPDLNFD